MTTNKQTLLLVLPVDWFFLSHRLALALEAKREGYRVVVAAKDTGRMEEIRGYGIEGVIINFDRSGNNPVRELRGLYQLVRLYRTLKPDVVNHITLKVSLVGSVAARIVGVPKVVNTITGLGFHFIHNKNSWRKRGVTALLKKAFSPPDFQYIFQNSDDLAELKSIADLRKGQLNLIKGSGINLQKFAYHPPKESNPLMLILPARMIREKGIEDFIEAAEICYNQYWNRLRWLLVGALDPDNPGGYTEEELMDREISGYLEWRGFVEDMASLYREADIVILPSYREGYSRTLMEAAATGRPIITTDVPGNRELIKDEENGYLVPVQNPQQIANRVQHLTENPELRLRMAQNNRQYAEEHFCENTIVRATLEVYGG